MEQTIHTVQQEQFRTWVLSYSDMLFSHAVSRGFDPDEAKDLVQDTFISAWRNREGFQHKASVKNWLFVILKNKITDEYRKASHHAKVQLSEYDVQFDDDGHWAERYYPRELTINPEDPSDQKEFNKILEGCISKLNTIHKAVFLMKYVDEVDSDAICTELSISSNNYWTIMHRAKTQLRACLEKHWLLLKNL